MLPLPGKVQSSIETCNRISSGCSAKPCEKPQPMIVWAGKLKFSRILVRDVFPWIRVTEMSKLPVLLQL